MDNERRGNIRCGVCESVCVGTERLNEHYRHMHSGRSSFPCGHCVKIFRDKNSMIRHIVLKHAELFAPDAHVRNANQNQPDARIAPPAQPHAERLNIDNEAIGQDFNDENAYNEAVGQDVNEEHDNGNVPISMEEELKKLAVKVLLDLR